MIRFGHRLARLFVLVLAVATLPLAGCGGGGGGGGKPIFVGLLQNVFYTLSDALLPTLTPAGDAARFITAIEIDETEPCDSGSLTLDPKRRPAGSPRPANAHTARNSIDTTEVFQ